MKQLDLHGTRHGDVRDKIDDFLLSYFNTQRYQLEPIEIITGHSDIMKDIVLEVLDEYKLCGEVDKYNTGKINVEKWL